MLPLIILLIVFILIAVRQIGSVKLQIWQIMLGGAIAVLAFGGISLPDALNAINKDVILSLLGFFIIGEALERSGYLMHLSYKMFNRAKSVDSLVLSVIFGSGLVSAFLMNDTIAIIGTPVVLLLAKNHKINSKMMLLALAFAITIGSAMSPIGNPQNLLIAINSGMESPFLVFANFLLLPTAINLGAAYLLLKFFYKPSFHSDKINHSQEPIKDRELAKISRFSLILLAALIGVKILIFLAGIKFDFSLTIISLISALPILLFSAKRFEVLEKIDWHTLIFFAAMFVLMQSVWNTTGFLQSIIGKGGIQVNSIPTIFLVSIIASQLISNVPLVALYLPLLQGAGASAKAYAALAAGSTIAGNLFILGAASNVIIIQNAEKKHNETITFWEFARIGIPLTIINAVIYWIFFSIV